MTEWASERLSEAHDLTQFKSGQPSLDLWLREHAAHAERMNTARTFVFVDIEQRVVGYYSLTMGRVLRGELPAPVARGAPRMVPVILIARLAVDRRSQGSGLGAELLWDALSRGCAANALAAARAFVVDAIDERAASFYEHFGFVRIEASGDTSIRLGIKTSTVFKSLNL